MKRTLISALLFSVAALAQDAPAPAEKPAPSRPAHVNPVGNPYIGCKDTKIFHRGSCKLIKGMDTHEDPNCPEFTWKAEAQQAGYAPCPECMTLRVKSKPRSKSKSKA